MSASVLCITQLLNDLNTGNRQAQEDLIGALYTDLRRMAGRAGARNGDTMCPTALVHDAYFRVIDKQMAFRDRFHFLSTMSVVMRNLVIDYARNRASQKRGGGVEKISMANREFGSGVPRDLEKLSEALEVLSQVNKRQAHMLELRYFGGLNLQEIADGMKVSIGTVSGELKAAQKWLAWRMRK